MEAMAAKSRAASSAAPNLLDRLLQSLRAKGTSTDGAVAPAAILWTDPRGEWQPLIKVAQTRAEELLVLGEYAPEARRGPATWLRCVVDRTLTDPALPEDRPPILYLPGVARQDLRAGEECPLGLRPLVELMFRGTLWLQQNGTDWGVTTFLMSSKALGLDIARDRATTEALLRALPEVAVTPLAQLIGRPLDADDFDRMLSSDVVRDLLRWMGDGEATRARLGDKGWEAFCSRARTDLGFDPETEADVAAGELLGKAEGPWSQVWQRFVEAPASYGDLAGLLRRSRPTDTMAFERERWPDLNDEDERSLGEALERLPDLGHTRACDTVVDLEKRHGRRRDWVWARLGLSPMAEVLAPLDRLATAARTAVGGSTPDQVAAAYADRGWVGDAASWEVSAVVRAADEGLVGKIVRHLLLPWLDASARAFQEAVAREPLPGRTQQPAVEAAEDTCVLFVDGLRYDVGQRLSERLESRGCRVRVGHRWAALPTVTATAKPAVTPVAHSVTGEKLEPYFATKLEATGKPATAAELRAEIRAHGYQVLSDGSFDAPMSHPARGWLETGDIDTLGHDLPARLARQIDDELERLTERVIGLLDAGWKSVRVVTDHGWLLLPGGLPTVKLPRHLTETQWARCAVIAGESTPDVTRAAWHWNPAEHFATPPGVACFSRSEWYAHGGLSIQECLIPDIHVERSGVVSASAAVRSITWRGLRCFVVATATGQVTADLRLERPSGESVAAAAKVVEEDGSVSLVLGDDAFEGAGLVLVLLDASGAILAHRPTRVGDEG